ncbi:MAG: AEC family transporter [Pseudomonadota bacterium]
MGGDPLALLVSALEVSVPTFGWVLLGLLLRYFSWISVSAVDAVSRIAFNYGLPFMLFAGAAQVDYSSLKSARYLAAGVLATLITLTLSWVYSHWRGHPRAQQGIFVQAAFRSNLAIVGLGLSVAAYGDRGPLLAALPVALMTALYNVLAVWVLKTTLGGKMTVISLLVGIAKNPLIIGIAAGVLASLLGLSEPRLLEPAGYWLSALFLPLMLICIGASMQLSQLRRAGPITWEGTAWRLCAGPLIAVLVALSMGVRNEQLGVLFLLLSSPVAAASFVMVVAAKGDGVLAANLVVLTTLLSVVTVTLGFFVLSAFSLVGQTS